MKGLFLRDTWGSWFFFAGLLVLVVSPLLATYYMDIIGVETSVSGRLVDRGFAANFYQYCSVAAGTGFNASVVAKADWAVAARFVGALSFTAFTVGGVVAAFIIARPLEYRYFFVELVFTGSRLWPVLARLAAVFSGLLLAVLSAGFPAAGILLVSGLYGFSDFARAYWLVTVSLLASLVSGVLLSASLSLGLKSTSGSVLAVIVFAALIAFLSAKAEWLLGLVNGAELVFYGKGVDAYLLLVAGSLAFTVWRAETIEY